MFMLNEAAGKRKNICEQDLIAFNSLEASTFYIARGVTGSSELARASFLLPCCLLKSSTGMSTDRVTLLTAISIALTPVILLLLINIEVLRTQSSGVILLLVLSSDKWQRDEAKACSLFCKLSATLRDRSALLSLMLITIKHSLFIHSLNRPILSAYHTKHYAMSW